jgi:hypothetical protein
MATSTALPAAVRAAFSALIDYAGLFPPAKLALAEARTEYAAAERGPYAWMLGRFIIPAPVLEGGEFHETVSAIAQPTAEAFEALGEQRELGAKIGAIEVPLEPSLTPFRESLSRDEILDVLGGIEADLAVAKLRDIPVYVEIPRRRPWWGALEETFAALARLRLGAKIRCGGVNAEAFPSVDDVAAFIGAACNAGVPFKATAGLHHPVRRLDALSGSTMHGFLNILAASALAPKVSPDTLREIVAEEDASAFAFAGDAFSWRDERMTLAQIDQMRRAAFVAYGSCSFTEPVEDLLALGILPAP